MLNFISHGDPGGKIPLLIAHGLYGSARNWGGDCKAAERRAPSGGGGHAKSWTKRMVSTHSYDDLAGDLAEVIAAHGGRMDVLGHSMGGKAAMVLALKYPGLVRRMVIADIAPTAYNHTQIHLIEAMNNVDLSAVERRSDVEAQLGQIDDPVLRSFLLQSLDLKAKKWRLNLEVLAAEMDKIIGFPQVTGRFEGDVLFLSGGTSDYVSRDDRPAIKALFPKAKFARIPGAGHWLLAEKPREFGLAVRAYLNG